jgi:pimeloyl-[acyl-carrier protein] synthase
VTTLQFNPLDPELIRDRHAIYRRFRDAGPVHFEETLGAHFVWGHDEARQVLKAPGGELHFAEFQSTRLPDGVRADEQPYCQGLRDFLLAKMGEDHSRVRRTFVKHFTPARVSAMHDQMTVRANDLVDTFVDRGEVEIMEAFALPLPLSLISSLLGIDESESARIAVHLRHFKLAIQLTPLDHDQLEQVNSGFARLQEIFTEIIAERRQNPGGDLLSMLISEHERGELTEGELFAAAWGLYAAGHESTAGFTGLSLITLLDHPDQLAALREDPTLITGAVEELFRYRGFAEATHRILPEAIELAGHRIPAGTPIVVYFTSANRDERWCPRAEEFDITVPRPGDHFAFSDGPHKCAGRHLARATVGVALSTLLARLPNLRLAGEVQWDLENLPIISAKRIPLAWDT